MHATGTTKYMGIPHIVHVLKVFGISKLASPAPLANGHLLASGHTVSVHCEDHNALSLAAPKTMFANMFFPETYHTFGSREAVA